MGDLRPLSRPFRARPADAAVVVDFDGTLSPIVDDPAAAPAADGAAEALAALAGRSGWWR